MIDLLVLIYIYILKHLYLFDNVYLSSKDAQANSGEGVRLAKNTSEKVNLKEIKTVSDCIPISSNPDIVADMEDLASTWCKQIEQVNYVNMSTEKTQSIVLIFYIAKTLPICQIMKD